MIKTEEITRIEEKQKKLGPDINYFFHKNERLKCQLYMEDLLAAYVKSENSPGKRELTSRFVSQLLLLLEAIDPGEDYIIHLKIDG